MRDRKQIVEHLAEQNCKPVFLSTRHVRDYYHGFCNKTIWPLFHYFPLNTVYEPRYWEPYKQANQTFCDVAADCAGSEDFIWIHDYQLMLLPNMLRERIPGAKIGFFLHIPFPSFELFRLLPWREELLEGILGADLIGFHTYDYVRHFLSCMTRIKGLEHAMGSLTVGDRLVKVDAFPLGIDYERYSGAVDSPEVKEAVEDIRKKIGDRRIIISIDRLDYTKGIKQRIEAFDLFLLQNPEYNEKVTLIVLAVPSRTGVQQYAELRRELESLVGRINGEHGTIGWVPIWYLYRAVPFERLVALYSVADVALVTPLRDGMNLIAKEYVATKVDGKGVLILSEMAGAASELGEAITVNANNKAAIIAAIKEALEMPTEGQIERNALMQERLRRYNVTRWANDFVEMLGEIKETQNRLAVRRLGHSARKNLIDSYRTASSRLLLLDYDGTLVGFAGRPEKAGPDRELLNLLRILVLTEGNEIVIISGRDRSTLDRWLGDIGAALIAEHGAWIRPKGGCWHTQEHFRNEWKETIRPILEMYTDRTPGSSLEEKDFSLVWHFRRSDPELAYTRMHELRHAVLELTANMDIGVFEGSKILEIKHSIINKGHAAQIWLEGSRWDFVLAAGDDYTDEDLFTVLPDDAFSVRIGYGISKARFNLDSVLELRILLEELTVTDSQQEITC